MADTTVPSTPSSSKPGANPPVWVMIAGAGALAAAAWYFLFREKPAEAGGAKASLGPKPMASSPLTEAASATPATAKPAAAPTVTPGTLLTPTPANAPAKPPSATTQILNTAVPIAQAAAAAAQAAAAAITPGAAAPAAAPAGPTTMKCVAPSGLTLHSGPNGTGTATAGPKNGATVQVVQIQNGWAQLTGNFNGWVCYNCPAGGPGGPWLQ